MADTNPENLSLGTPAGPRADPLSATIYDELREMAGRFLIGRREDTLSPTVLVHEAYLRLVQREGAACQSRAHFFGLAAKAMRSILVDYVRRHGAAKRGGGHRVGPLEEEPAASPAADSDLPAIDAALTRLAEFNTRRAQIVELRFFGGLTVEEVAETLEISPATVKREWTLAKAWLRREIGE